MKYYVSHRTYRTDRQPGLHLVRTSFSTYNAARVYADAVHGFVYSTDPRQLVYIWQVNGGSYHAAA